MKELVFLLEEMSARAMLEAVVPKILGDASVQMHCLVFRGKNELDKRLKKRLAGYRKPGVAFLVLRDQDSGDCKKIKQDLLDKIPGNIPPAQIRIRLACCELESFYLGDLSAVEKGMGINLASEKGKRRYQNPDNLRNAKQELMKLTDMRYQPVADSRAIAAHLNLHGGNTSHSFNMLINAIRTLADG